MALANLKPNQKSVTAMLIFVVILFFACIMIYVLGAGKLKAVESEMQAKEEQVKTAAKTAQLLEKSKLEYLDARAQIDFLEVSVSDQAYVPTLLKQLEYLGKETNLRVIGVKPQADSEGQTRRSLSSAKEASEGNVDQASKSKKKVEGSEEEVESKTPYNELKIDVEATGKYMNALDFIYKLTRFPKIIAVNSVQIYPSASDIMGSPELNIKVNVTAFVFKDKKPLAPLEIDKVSPQDGQSTKAPVKEMVKDAG
ncbi:MAG: type 4a pilus biogenesis protein PilO [Armatimonadota bacterium]